MVIKIGGTVVVILTFISMILLSNGVADLHYRTYKGHLPLYFVYGFLFVMVWFFAWEIIIHKINIHK